jgi:hypothetical protein
MKKPIIYLVFSGIISILMSCDNQIYVCQPNQKVLFQCERINYAWGDFHRGWILDSEGYVRAYVQPEHWTFPNSSGMISDSAMQSNLIQADSICMQLDLNELSDKVSLIEQASKGDLSKPVNEMCDYGALVYNCYMYDQKTKTYHCFLLNQYGDFMISNKSNAAKKLYEWLQGITNQVAP